MSIRSVRPERLPPFPYLTMPSPGYLSRVFALFALSLSLRLSLTGIVRAAEPYEAFIQKHCSRCHGPEKEKGDLRFDKLSRDFKLGGDTHHWAEAMEQVNSGEMPPKKDKEPKPTQAEIAAFVTSLDGALKAGRASRQAARPAVAHYRLSRQEYQNTVYDLLGVRYDPAKQGELNEDTRLHGFERIGSELSLSPSHVDRYYRAAGVVLERAFTTAGAETRKVRKTAAELLPDGGKWQQAVLDRFGIKRPLRSFIYPGAYTYNGPAAFSTGWLGKGIGPEHSGLYKVRIKASGIRPPGGQPAHLTIGIPAGGEGGMPPGSSAWISPPRKTIPRSMNRSFTSICRQLCASAWKPAIRSAARTSTGSARARSSPIAARPC